MRRVVIPVLVGATVLLGVAAGDRPARAQAGRRAIDIVKVEGVIDPALSAYARGELESAARDDAVVILQLDSRGAYDEHAVELARTIRGSTAPVVAWVGPVGSRVEGGALFLAYASGLVAVAPGAGIGPARPFDLGDSVAREDAATVARLGAELVALGPGAGADPSGLQRLLAGESLAAGPAIEAGVASLAASNPSELIAKLDGRTIRAGRGTEVLSTVGEPRATIRFHEPGPVTRILHGAATPTAVYVLLVLGLWGVAFELTQPGVGAAGIAGGLALGFAAYELSVIPVGWLGVVMILAGIALQGIDVLVRRVGVLTIAGTAAFAAGSVLAWRGVAPPIDLAWWLVAIMTIGGLLFFGFGMTVALRSRERIRAAQVGLVGLVGEVRSDLNPEGGVFVKGAMWRARSMDGPIPKGRRVRVRGVEGLILRVQEEPD